ncbi:MAG: septum formation initiator family protein [bacterium]
MAARKKSGGGAGFKRILIAAGVLAALVFAVQGGEYGTRDLLHQRERKARLTTAIDSAQRVVDSLKRYKRRLETDPVLQERLAREEFGMVRGTKELLYRIAEPAASGDSATPKR